MLVEAIPSKLNVAISTHVITAAAGPIPCWTYVSDGLAKLGQAEIALTVKREPDEADDAFPRAPIDLFASIHHFASTGRFVREGGSTRLGAGGPGFLRPDLTGILYTPSQRLAGVATPSAFLTAMVLTGPELQVAEQFGHLRVMTLLGNQTRFFPTAPWLDRRRAEFVRPEVVAGSVLTKVARVRTAGASVHREVGAPPTGAAGAKVVLRVRRGAAQGLAEGIASVPANRGLALLVDMPPDADAAMVWTPGSHEAQAIAAAGATGARIAANFLMIAPGVDSDGAREIEDGYGLMLTQSSWDRLRAAIASGSPIELAGADPLLGFALTWVEETYQNPVDGRTYVAQGGWQTYPPRGAAPAAETATTARAVRLAGVRLLQAEAEMDARIEVKAFAQYTRDLETALDGAIGADPGPAFDVLVQVELTPSARPRIQMTVQPPEAPVDASTLATRLAAVAPPEVTGPVRFIAGYRARGGTGGALP